MNMLEKTRVALSAAIPAARLLLAHPAVHRHRWLAVGAVAAVAVVAAAGLGTLDVASLWSLLTLLAEIVGG